MLYRFCILPYFQVQFSLLSLGDEQLEIKNICDSLGIQLIAYSPLGLGMLTGKYSSSNLPSGPRLIFSFKWIVSKCKLWYASSSSDNIIAYRSFLFRQILPGLEPLLLCLREIANKRQKTMSQVCHTDFLWLLYFMI